MAKILLVEDDNNLREIYEARLQAEGYEIVSANDGETALVAAKKEKPDLIISDVMMPKISGFEMLDILRNTDELKHTKVIMLTALGQADDQARATSLGADRYLVKSQVTLEDIVKVSHELLEGAGAATASPAASASGHPAPPPSDPPADTPASASLTTPDEPASAPAVSTADPTGAPSQAQEENDVEKQIQDFVATQPAAVPAAAPATADNATVTPEVTTPETNPTDTHDSLGDGGAAATPASTPQAQAADDKVLADAVQDLNSATEPPVPSAATGSKPATASAAEPSPAPEASAPAGPEPHPKTGGERVIQPLNSTPTPDLNALLAAEEAKEAAEATGASQPVVGSSNERPAGAPTPPSGSQPDADKPVDPNSIAL